MHARRKSAEQKGENYGAPGKYESRLPYLIIIALVSRLTFSGTHSRCTVQQIFQETHFFWKNSITWNASYTVRSMKCYIRPHGRARLELIRDGGAWANATETSKLRVHSDVVDHSLCADLSEETSNSLSIR
jgi:hypothetical protein